jgi:lysophospholipase L1-like esterase
MSHFKYGILFLNYFANIKLLFVMNEKTKNSPAYLLIIVILTLSAVSLLYKDFNFLGMQIKSFDLFEDIKQDSLLQSDYIFTPKVNHLGSAYGIMLPLVFDFRDNTDYLQGNTSQMNYFYTALKQHKKKKVRIAHFGDSIIEGDLITHDFRGALQSRFGGEGIGMVSVTPEDTRFRVTVKHSFSDDWRTYSVFGGNPHKMGIGINGTVSIPSSGSWIKLESSGIPGTFKTLNKVFIYYSGAKKSSLKYSLNNSLEKSVHLETGEGLHQLVIDGANSKSIKITATQDEQLRIYGISIESENGIIVDNLPLRGNSGISIRDISPGMMKSFNEYLDYKLILLEFGLNMITSGQNDYDWYEKEMVKVIDQLKSAFPETSILLISVTDKSIKKGSRFVTDPKVKKLVDVQKKISESAGIAFWNLYESMGGENSMIEWVNSKPPLAMKDFTHFNNEGARKIGRMLSKAVLEGFE